MKVIIQKAKNGEDTALIDGHFLHSNYNPQKEAERFAENLNLSYTPSCIIITEPALSYSAVYLKKKYPEIKIGAIRYTEDFSAFNSYFDFILDYYNHTDFETYLENTLTEDILLTAHFINWQPSSQAFHEIDYAVWNAIKAALERAKTLLITRQYFEKKWLINSFNFLGNLRTICTFDTPIKNDVLIISSGPSLKPFIPIICENQKKFFIICLSSAISACLKNQIIPDLCMTTDGGYWAGAHLKKLYKNDIPAAMPAEACCPKSLLSKLSVIPLNYGDGVSNDILNTQDINTKKALRNGTVSGTALLFAAEYFTGNIYLCGLDMASQTGYQHTQPNELESNSAYKDTRIINKETRIARSGLTNDSLKIYRSWFCNNPLGLKDRKVLRLIEEKDSKNSLNWINDMNLKTFGKIAKESLNQKDYSFKTESFTLNRKSISDILNNTQKTETWKRQLYPLDFVQLTHNPENKEILEKIEKQWLQLKTKAERILNGNI